MRLVSTISPIFSTINNPWHQCIAWESPIRNSVSVLCSFCTQKALYSVDMSTSNPLLSQDFLIPFDQIRPEYVTEAVDHVIADANKRIEHLAALQVTENTEQAEQFMPLLDQLTEQIDSVSTLVYHLSSVLNSPEWQAVKEENIPKYSEFYTNLSLHTGLWQTLKSFAQTDTAQKLDPVRARHLKLTIEDFQRSGADLPQDKKERLRELNTELAQTTNQYGVNVLEATAAYDLYVSTEQLDGVPERIKESTRLAAEAAEKEGHRLTLHFPVSGPVLTYAHDRKLRQTLWEAENRLGTQDERDNRPLVSKILRLRREQAQLLGFEHFADYVLQERMAGTGQKALQFENRLEEQTRPAFEREKAELEAFYLEEAGADAPAMEPWDVAYWAEKQRQAKYDFDAEVLRPYFPMEQVLRGLFELCRRVFGITVSESEAPVWHPEVKYYDIHDDQGVHLASFYTDWFPRDSKRSGAWMNAFKTGGPCPDGGFSPHIGVMCGNMTAPSGNTPALLSLDEVETVFHEFGHLLHHALSRVEVRSLSGTSVPWDFVELPSQFMENWVTERESLDLIAKHYQTDECIPDELYERMIAAKNYRAASFAMRQYSFGLTDLCLHIQFDPADDTDPITYAHEIMQRFSPVPLPKGYAMVARFGHLFSSPVGYGAGYYSYKWAEVLDADAFSRFANEGLFSREVGQSYLDSILSKGNSQDPAELFRNFMGRDPDSEALLRRSGLLT